MNIRAIALSLALGAAPFAVHAQGAQTESQDANPHDTKNKDRPSRGKGSRTAVQQGETANPHSVDNKDKKPAGNATADAVEAAESDNPHSVRNAKKKGGMKHHRMSADGGTMSTDAGTMSPDAGTSDAR